VGSNPFLAAIMAVAILNGIFSPFFVVTSQVMLTAILPPLLLAGPSFVAFFGSLVAATATIMLAGIAAALFERLTGRRSTDAAAYSVWLVTTIVISFPALLRAAALAL
jgi:hypothetical protein